jgi:hypothetical protein
MYKKKTIKFKHGPSDSYKKLMKELINSGIYGRYEKLLFFK